jgi:hypothetical protein
MNYFSYPFYNLSSFLFKVFSYGVEEWLHKFLNSALKRRENSVAFRCSFFPKE